MYRVVNPLKTGQNVSRFIEFPGHTVCINRKTIGDIVLINETARSPILTY